MVSSFHVYMYNMYHHIIHILGVHTFAALNASEKYEEMKEGFGPVLDEINDLIDEG